MKTEQIKFWEGEFGKEYTDRNSFDFSEWESFHVRNWGHKKADIMSSILDVLPFDAKI